jgi:hypothetical protein
LQNDFPIFYCCAITRYNTAPKDRCFGNFQTTFFLKGHLAIKYNAGKIFASLLQSAFFFLWQPKVYRKLVYNLLTMLYRLYLLAIFGACPGLLCAQMVPILQYSVDAGNQAHLRVASTEDHYYVLYARHQADGALGQPCALVMGQNGSTELIDPLAALPAIQYQVKEFLRTQAADTDADGMDDLSEWAQRPARSPFNAAPEIDPELGVAMVPNRQVFKQYSRTDTLGGKAVESLKFYIRYRDTPHPSLYFIHSTHFNLHTDFAAAIGYYNDGTLMTGALLYHPDVPAPNGTLGVYRIVFQPNNTFSLEYVQKALEMLSANLPFLKNNLCYYPLPQVGVPLYWQEKAAYDSSRVCVLLEDDLYADVDYLALNPAEGYGLLRAMAPGETPGARDLVIYTAIPNELPRVGGIITTVMQTPLSHVNLRAIQDKVPNVFLRDALQIPAVQNLLGKYVYFKAAPTGYTLREASIEEVNAHFDALRPQHAQFPLRDLSEQRLLPLDSIYFDQATAFGVKCANVATMRRFGFPGGVIPDGFGIPFYFYDAFMQYNGLYARAQEMMADPVFQQDASARAARLSDFQKKIRSAPMPDWMMTALATMQAHFPEGVSIRCRSSTNNEDLEGFSGAGLYDSKTQHPDEGHIAKSIKQVYASIWNFRAFEERDFYRVDHLQAAMGVLVHPNHEQEQANGVGVSTDPVYRTEKTFYLNTQIGADLVTNPNALSVPEEMLLDAEPLTENDYVLVNPSNLAPPGSLILSALYRQQLRDYLKVIHQRFAVLYRAEKAPDFAMEIEYKIDVSGQLVIKQARPWAGYQAEQTPADTLSAQELLREWPNPFHQELHLYCTREAVMDLELLNIQGQLLRRTEIDFRRSDRRWDLGDLPAGAYLLRAREAGGTRLYSGIVFKM